MRSVLRRPTTVGGAAAVVAWFGSLTPSLLPRQWLVQSLVSAASVLVYYLAGSAAGWLLHLGLTRVRRQPSESARRRIRQVLATGALAAVLIGMFLWPSWQHEQRALIGAPQRSWWWTVPMALGTAVIVLIVGSIARLVWGRIEALDRWLDRRISHGSAAAWTAITVTVFAQVLVQGVVWDGFADWAAHSYGPADADTPAGVVQPTSELVSGGPGSLVPWETLGREGKGFVAGATTLAELHAFHGADAEVTEPIRVYAGSRSAAGLAAEADLVVDELRRTGAFDRAVLVVAMATGTGWIEPHASAAIEQMWSGDTAIASMQYSYLPSWMAFLIDNHDTAPAGSALFNAVHRAWAALPEDDRPLLLVFGESLGVYAAEAPFAGFDGATSVANMEARTDGMLLAGPTPNSRVWRQLVAERAAGSPAWQPEFGGGSTVRVFTSADDIAAAHDGWDGSRIVYLVYPTDPVTGYDLRTAWTRPGWLDDPTAPTVMPEASWLPGITVFQSLGDLVDAWYAPNGRGHNYEVDLVDAWAAVRAPAGWTAVDTERLREFLAEEPR